MKKVLILSGIPGCGKSTFAGSCGPGAYVCSADNYFIDQISREYKFDPSRLAVAHSDCMNEFLDCMRAGADPIIVDNTNISVWEWQNYAAAAEMMGYRVELHMWKVETIADLLRCAERNQHGVPIETVTRMALQHATQSIRSDAVIHRVA